MPTDMRWFQIFFTVISTHFVRSYLSPKLNAYQNAYIYYNMCKVHMSMTVLTSFCLLICLLLNALGTKKNHARQLMGGGGGYHPHQGESRIVFLVGYRNMYLDIIGYFYCFYFDHTHSQRVQLLHTRWHRTPDTNSSRFIGPVQWKWRSPLWTWWGKKVNAGAAWAIQSYGMFEVMEKRTLCINVRSVDGSIKKEQAMLGFIDDSFGGVTSVWQQQDNELDLLKCHAKKSAQTWEQVLYLLGSLLEYNKTFVQPGVSIFSLR